ncbi:LCP family protein required for cell wall assembly [Nocardia transvalensis]|uniref:LCP family protein required for cell wall assembly n=1 Tax=Nocardia transvalensis TaxID=37333 RepID=A0A7W9UHX2_9NOCA|nr:LCP family protein [Nocardia transvalensis]MBB5913125.1 LCP family protein required for cell wall assembly [Nocardia transvalensis]
MGDDERRGRTSGPGGRAPWERYPAPDSGDDDPSPRRNRHADDDSSGSGPVTVHDLMQKVDNERSGGRRARRAAAERAAAPPPPPPADRRRRGGNQPPQGNPPPRGNAGPPQAPPPQGQPPLSPRGNQAPPPQGNQAPPQGKPRGNQPPSPQGNPVPPQGQPAPPPRGNKAPPPPGADDRPTDTVAPAAALGPVAASIRAPGSSPSDPAPAGGRRPPVDPATDKLPVPESESPAERPSTGARPKTVGAPTLSRLAQSKQRQQQRLQLVGRGTTAFVAVLALLVTGIGWNYLRATDNGFQQVSALDEKSDDIVDPGGQLGDENFLIVGTDTRAGVDGNVGAGSTEDAEGARADTVMLVHIPENRQRVVAVSFPRDLDVTRPSCEGWDNEKATYNSTTFPQAAGDKLNATYALGGPKCLTKVIQKLVGLRIGHFIGIDFNGFSSMVDTIGGVEVCTRKPLVDDELGTILPNPGRQMLNGPTALDYVRARHVYGEERSDYDRIHRQQLFLSSLLRGALSSKVLFDIGKLNGFINAFSNHAFMDAVNTKDLLMLGRSLQKVDAGAITFLTVPTAGTTSYGNEIPRESDIKEIFKAVIDDQPLPGEKKAPEPSKAAAPPPPKQQQTAVDPSTFSVQVSNGSGSGGLANTTATKLSNQGFQIYNVGNYSGGTIPATKVRYSSGHEAEAATVASAIPGATLESTSGLGSIVELALGSDFGGTVHAPTPFGSPLPDVPTAAAGGADGETPATLPSDLEHVNAADDNCK